VVCQQIWSIWCNFVCFKLPTACRRQAYWKSVHWMRHMMVLPYLQKQKYWQSQRLLFATTNKRYAAFLVCSYSYQSTAKQHHYSCKIIVYVGSSQRSKSWHSYLHNTCTMFQVETKFANWPTSRHQSIFLNYFTVPEA